jgi:hypothetical protein
MKIKILLAASVLGLSAALRAATLNSATAVQIQPDPSSPVILVLKAGSDQPAASDKAGVPPAGWIAVEVAGPFEGYVRNKDLTKQLDVRPAASVYIGPKEASGVLTVFEKGDKAEITGIHGSWTQVRLDKTLVGYIQTAPMAPVESAATPAVSPAAPAAAPAAAAPETSGEGASASLSRLFEGTLASTRSILVPKRPYEWQLADGSGKRIAYVDLTKLLMTDQIENYAGHGVVVLGSLEPVKDTDDLVIEAEGLRLK